MRGQTLERLREVLYEPPSAAVWDAVVEALEREAEPVMQALAVDYARSVLDAGWPERLRCAPRRWWLALLASQEVPGWALVRTLEVEGSAPQASLLRSGHVSRIAALRLGEAPLSVGAIAQLQGSAPLGQVRTLEIAGARWLGVREVRALDGLPWSALEVLRLSGAPVGVPVMQALCGGAWARGGAGRPALVSLELADAPLAPEALEVLWGNLLGGRHLSLSGVSLDERGARVLCGSGGPPTMVSLDLSGNALGGALGRLGEAPFMRRLESLEVRSSGLFWRDLRGFARKLEAPCLERLVLDGNFLEEEGAVQLAACEGMRALRVLSLVDTRLGDAGAAALAAAPWLRRVEVLDVSENPLGEAGLEALRRGMGPEAQLVFRSRKVRYLDP